MIPWVVIQELDKLKMRPSAAALNNTAGDDDDPVTSSKSDYLIKKRANEAIVFISDLLNENNSFFLFESASQVIKIHLF